MRAPAHLPDVQRFFFAGTVAWLAWCRIVNSCWRWFETATGLAFFKRPEFTRSTRQGVDSSARPLLLLRQNYLVGDVKVILSEKGTNFLPVFPLLVLVQPRQQHLFRKGCQHNFADVGASS